MAPLDDLLRARGVTLTELERTAVVTRMTASRWRRGLGRPQRAACLRIARALGLDFATVADAVVATISQARRRAVMPVEFFDTDLSLR